MRLPIILAAVLLATAPAFAGEKEGDAAMRTRTDGSVVTAPAHYRDAIAAARGKKRLAVLWSKLGCALERAGEHDGKYVPAESAAAFRKAIELDPVLAFPYYGLARTMCDRFAHATQCAEALQQIGRALARDSGVALFWQEKAAIEAESKAPLDSSVADCRKAQRVAPAWDAPGMQSCGSFYYRAGLTAEGKAADAAAMAARNNGYSTMGDRDLRYLDLVLSLRAKREKAESEE